MWSSAPPLWLAALITGIAACTHLEPSLAYRSLLEVPRAPLSIALEVELLQATEPPPEGWAQEIDPVSLTEMQGSLRDALASDLSAHGPFQLDPVGAEATLALRAVVFAVGDGTAWSSPWLALSLLFGAPRYSYQLALVADGQLIDRRGRVLASVAARMECKRWSGLYYGYGVSMECAVRPVLEAIRAQLSSRAPAIFAKLERAQRARLELAARPLVLPADVPGPRPVVAVFDVEDGAGLLGPLAAAELTAYLSTRLAERARYRMVPRAQLLELLEDAKAESYRPCYDAACQIELGKAVAAQKSVAARLLRVGDTCAMTATVFDLRSETAERGATVKTACQEGAVLDGVDRLVEQLAGS